MDSRSNRPGGIENCASGYKLDVIDTPELIAAIGPRIRTSPFFDRTVEAGLTSVSAYNHMWLPMSYGDPDGEYDALTTGVTMWDVAAQRHIEVAGPGADEAVQLLTVIDTAPIPIGRAVYAPMVDHDGRVINDPVLFHLDEGGWRFSISDSDVRAWMSAIVAQHGLDCRVGELDTATLAIQGPESPTVIESLGLSGVAELEQFELISATVDGDIELLVSRSGWSEQGGIEMLLDDSTQAGRLWAYVAEMGEASGIRPAAPNPAERIENFLLSYGTDTGYDADPFELGLGDLVDFDVDAFVGRDALLELRDQVPARKLLGVRLDGSPMEPLSRPAPAAVAGELVGRLRAAAWSPRFEVNLGLAMLHDGVDSEDTVDVDVNGDVTSGTLVDLPFDE